MFFFFRSNNEELPHRPFSIVGSCIRKRAWLSNQTEEQEDLGKNRKYAIGLHLILSIYLEFSKKLK